MGMETIPLVFWVQKYVRVQRTNKVLFEKAKRTQSRVFLEIDVNVV